MNLSKPILRAILVLFLSAGQAIVAAPGRMAVANEGVFIVNTAIDTNAQDPFLSLREAIAVANGDLTSGFSNGEKAQMAGCVFTGSDGSDPGNPAIGGWDLDLTGPGCGAAITDSIRISLPTVSGEGAVLTLTLGALPPLSDTAPTLLLGSIDSPPDFAQIPTIDASNIISSDGLRLISNGNQLLALKVRGAQRNGIRIDGNANTVYLTGVYSNAQAGIAIHGDQNQLYSIMAGHAAPDAAACDGLGNSGSGVLLESSASANLVSQVLGVCNGVAGVEVSGANNTTISGVYAKFNDVGVVLSSTVNTTFTGMTVANNVGSGIVAIASSDMVLGGAMPNVLMENEIGVALLDSGNSTISNTQVISNGTGIHLDGAQYTRVYSNVIREQRGAGVALINGANNNTIGDPNAGVTPDCSNVIVDNQRLLCSALRSPAQALDDRNNRIAGNRRSGVTVTGAGTRENVINANFIYSNSVGIMVTGAATGTFVSNVQAYANQSHGIVFSGTGTTGNSVIDSQFYENGGDGINEQAGADGNQWSKALFYSNGGLGVDKNAGPDSSNTPDSAVPQLAQYAGGWISGTATAGSRVDIYAVTDLYRDPSGFGEGEYVASVTATLTGTWSVSHGFFPMTGARSVAAGPSSCYSAIQTVGGASSEFSRWRCMQEMTFTAPSTAYVGITRALTIAVSSGLSVSVVSATLAICSVTGTTVTAFARGVCELSAAPVASANYFPAALVTQRITVRLGAHEVMIPLVRR